jgi:signal transduction histidine kinase
MRARSFSAACLPPHKPPYFRHRLYRQIYYGVMSIVVVVCLLVGATFWAMGQAEPAINPKVSALLMRLLPASDNAEELGRTVEELSKGMRGHVGLYDASGQRIAASTPRLPRHLDWSRNHRWMRDYPLPDGRHVIMVWTWQNIAIAFSWLVGIAALVALAAWPVSRRLTRRLERLKTQASAWSEGQLSARLEIDGCDEVTELAQRFNQAAERIEALVSSQRMMLASASHELRSPLARIRMAVDLLGEDRPDLRAQIAHDITELDALIGELLLASRLADELPRMDIGRVDLSGLAAEEAARVDACVAGESLVIKGDARLLRQLVRNLLENARRHGGGTRIEVELTKGPDEHALLRVMDRGPGVPETEREKIFEPFYRPAGNRERGDGAGFGLALVRRIARLHGGDVVCRERDGGGSVFEVGLPCGAA